MVVHGVSKLIFYICFLFLANINKVAAEMDIQPVGSSVSSFLNLRAELNLTLSMNATTFVQDLDFTANCTLAIEWHDQFVASGVGSGDDPRNVAFLRMALPEQYGNNTDDEIASFYDEMSSGALSITGWLVTAINVIEIGCISPQLERQVTFNDLNTNQNCTTTALFLGILGWLTEPQNYTFNKENDHSWQEFLRAALPVHIQESITDLELFSYRSYFLATETADNITMLLRSGYEACQADICELQGYKGNPDVGGIGASTYVHHRT
jgi:hypothetical protein